jgi:hypothetical protein
MKRTGLTQLPKSRPGSRFEICDDEGELQVRVKPKLRSVADWIGWIIAFPFALSILLFFLGITGYLAGVFVHQAIHKHWGNTIPAMILVFVFVFLLVPLRIVISEAADFVMPGIRRLRVTRDGLAWTQREWFGERKIPAAEIEELYVSSNGHLVTITDRLYFMMNMSLTDEKEGAWLRDQILARFSAEPSPAAPQPDSTIAGAPSQ